MDSHHPAQETVELNILETSFQHAVGQLFGIYKALGGFGEIYVCIGVPRYQLADHGDDVPDIDPGREIPGIIQRRGSV